MKPLTKAELEKAFKALSKDDEKAKKLLSKEIEKNRAFAFIKKAAGIAVYHTRHNTTGYEMRIGPFDGDCIFIEISKETYDQFKEVLENAKD